MKLPRGVDARQLIKALGKLGYRVARQTGLDANGAQGSFDFARHSGAAAAPSRRNPDSSF